MLARAAAAARAWRRLGWPSGDTLKTGGCRTGRGKAPAGAFFSPRGRYQTGVMASSLPIGDFSRATHMSIKALRHYHRVGLLEPADVDPFTGHRRYTTDQIPAAQVIRRFRALDMPIEDIRAVLTAPGIPARNELIAAHLSRLEEGLARTQNAVTALQDLLSHAPDPARHRDQPPQRRRGPRRRDHRGQAATPVAVRPGFPQARGRPRPAAHPSPGSRRPRGGPPGGRSTGCGPPMRIAWWCPARRRSDSHLSGTPGGAPDRDRVQARLEELRRHDRLVVVGLADRRLQRLDHGVVVGLVEVDERDEILVRCLGLWREHAVPVGLPPAAGPAGEQVTGVDREGAWLVGRVLPAVLLGPHLQATAARLTVEDGDRAEIGVRADPELAGFWLHPPASSAGTS